VDVIEVVVDADDDSKVVVAAVVASINGLTETCVELTEVGVEEVRTISLYSLTIALRFIIVSVVDVEDDNALTVVAVVVVVTIVVGMVLVSTIAELEDGDDGLGVVDVVNVFNGSDNKGRRMRRFLIRSLLSGLCGNSSSVLGVRGVIFPFA